MALKDIAINIAATGVDQTVQGMGKVGDSASDMGRKTTSATAQAAANWDKMQRSLGDSSTATGKAAAGMLDVENAAGLMGSGLSVVQKLLAGFGIGFSVAAIVHGIRSAIASIDEFEVSVIQIAAQLTQMQAGKGGNLGKIFQDSSAYAEVLADKMQEIDANSFASNKGLMAMLQTMTMQGVVLDVNNKAQVETFTSLSNAVAMYTAGQDQEIQARQEMRALMSGEVNQHSQLSRIIDTQIKQQGIYKGGLKEVVELGQQHGDTLQRLSPYLQGINAASESINKTWSAASSSLETAVNKVTREGFSEVFHEIVPAVSQMANHLKDSSGVSDIVHRTWLALKGTVSTVADLLSVSFKVPLEVTLGLTGKILDGWGLLLSSVLPVLADEFKHLIGLLNAAVNLGYSFGLVMLDAVGAVGSAIASVGKASMQALTGDFDGAAHTLQGMFSGTYVERFKENMVVVKGTVIAMGEEWKAMQDPIGRMLDKADQYMLKTQKAKASATAPPGTKPPADAPAGIDTGAYEKEQEKFREAYRALYSAQDKSALQDAKNATAQQMAELENRHKLGLVSEQNYLDQRHALQSAESDRDISTLMRAAERAQEAMEKAKGNVGQRPSDGSDESEVDRWNKSVLVSIKTATEFTEAMARVSVAVAKAKLEDSKDVGATDLHAQAMQRYADETAIQQMQLEGNRIGAEYAANELKYSDLKKKGYTDEEIGLTRVNDAIKMANDLFERQLAIRKQLDALKSENSSVTASMVGTNSAGGFDSIADQTANALAVQEEAHNQRMRQIQDEQDANTAAMMAQQESYKDYLDKKRELDKAAALENQKNSKATTGITQKAYDSQLQAVSYYTGLAGNLFGELANAQDQSSRAGFNTAKAFSMSATVVSTAAAVMNALATVQPYPAAIAAAAAAAATGAIQLGVIASTTFGSGSSAPVGVSAGSFGGGGGGASSTVGSAIGAPIQYGSDAASSESIALLAANAQSASLAVGDLTAAFKSSTKAFSENGTGASLVDRIIGMVSGQITSADGASDALSDPQLIAGVDAIVQAGIDTITKAAAALGTGVGPVNVTPTGWTGELFNKEGVAKTLNDAIASVMNDYAKAVQGLEAYAKPGEDASVALSRLSGALYSVNNEFDKLGITLLSGLAGANIASKLQDAFTAKGEDLSKAMDNYFSGLFSDEEQKAMKAAQAQREVTSSFVQMGLAVPQTNAQFISLVNSLDLTTAQGESTFATLMSISESFGVMTKQAEALKKAQADLERDVTSRSLKLISPDAADIYDLYAKQTQELTDAQQKGLDTTGLVTVQTQEYAAALDKLVKSQSEARLSYLDDLQSRALKAGGNSTAADLLTLLANQEKALTDARAKGYDVTELLTVQQEEYSQKLAALQSAAQQKMLDAQLSFNDLAATARQKAAGAQLAFNELISGARDKVVSAQKSYDDALASQMKKAQEDTINSQLKSAQDVASAWKSASQSIQSSIDSLNSASLSTMDPAAQLGTLRARFSSTLQSVLAGNTEAAGNLGSLGNDYAGAAKATSVTREDYLVEVGKIQASLTRAKNLSDSRGTAADRQAAIMQSQLDLLNQVNDNSVADAAQALTTAQSELAALEALHLETSATRESQTEAAALALNTAQAELAAIQALHLETSATRQSQAETAAATLSQAQLDYKATQTLQETVTAQLLLHQQSADQAHQDALGIMAGLQTLSSTVSSLASLTSLPSLTTKTADNYLYGNSALPQYASGTPYVSGDQIAQIHDREIVMDAQSSEILRRYGIKVQGDGNGGSNEALLKQLISEVQALRAEQRAQADAIAQNTGASAKLAKRWEGNGLPPTREAA